jgi:hypothetical protein
MDRSPFPKPPTMTDLKLRLLRAALQQDVDEIKAEWSGRPESYAKIATLWNQALEEAYPGKKIRYNAMDAFRLLDRPERKKAA